MQWYYYVGKDGNGYWSATPPYATTDRYIAWVVSDNMPTGGPHQS